MAENEAAAENAEEEESGESEGNPGRKKKLIMIAAAVVVLLGGGAGAYFFLLAPPAPEDLYAQEEVVEEPTVPDLDKTYTYYELPELLINLERGDGYANYLKIQISLELDNEELVPLITQLEPRIHDVFLTYLRALHVSDLNGSAAVYRLRRALKHRLNLVTDPVEVRDVLFKDILVQ